MRWRASIGPQGRPVSIEAPSWFLARQQASIQLGATIDQLVVQRETAKGGEADGSGGRLCTTSSRKVTPPADSTSAKGRRAFTGLRVRWSRSEQDLLFEYDKHPPDGHLLYSALCRTAVLDGRSLVDELKARGFDVTTLKLTIQRVKP